MNEYRIADRTTGVVIAEVTKIDLFEQQERLAEQAELIGQDPELVEHYGLEK